MVDQPEEEGKRGVLIQCPFHSIFLAFQCPNILKKDGTCAFTFPDWLSGPTEVNPVAAAARCDVWLVVSPPFLPSPQNKSLPEGLRCPSGENPTAGPVPTAFAPRGGSGNHTRWPVLVFGRPKTAKKKAPQSFGDLKFLTKPNVILPFCVAARLDLL